MRITRERPEFARLYNELGEVISEFENKLPTGGRDLQESEGHLLLAFNFHNAQTKGDARR